MNLTEKKGQLIRTKVVTDSIKRDQSEELGVRRCGGCLGSRHAAEHENKEENKTAEDTCRKFSAYFPRKG